MSLYKMDPPTQEELILQAKIILESCPKWVPDLSKCAGCKVTYSKTHKKFIGCIFCDEDWDLPELV